MFVSIRKSISSVLLSALVVGLLPPLPAFAQELSQSNASDIPQIASDALTSESSSASVALSSQSSVDNLSDASASPSSQQDKLTESTTAAGVSSSSPSVKAVAAPSHGSPIDYAMLMHRMIRLRKGDPVILPDTTKDTKDIWQQDMQLLKDEERTKLASLNLDPSLIDSHISTIETMITKVDQPFESASPEFNIPDNPSSFERVADDTTVRFLKPEDIQLINLKDEWQPEASLLQKIISFFFPQAKADGTPQLPVLADTQTDGKEVVLSSAMIDLAQTLDKNPLKITNYVRSTIAFEPYAGSKKGAEGCLREKTCNDADTAALTISLLRASGIPARYRKTAGLMTRAQAQSLLGVDNPKSVYYLLAANGRPTYVVGSALPNPETTTLEQADFSSVTHFYTEWIGVEAFIDYDERGGSYTATTDFSAAKTDNDVASLLLPYEKKTWIYIDPTFQQTTRAEKALPANTDMVQFVESHMRSTDTRTPVQHFNAVAGVDLFNPDSQTKVTPIDIPYDILPPTPPFALGLTNDIAVEKWSSLPELFRQKVTLSVRKASDSTQLLTQTLYGYQMHDQEFDLSYKGATLADQQIIDSYGGIYATPPGLVKIIPIFSDDQIRTDGAVPVKIGESLIVRFVVTTRNEKQLAQDRTNEKFSVAGNNEGIYMTFSQAYEDLSRPSKELVLLGGNASMARHYVAKLQQTQQQLAGVYDQTAISQFSRAIVTENRVVSLVNGAPTTFDFKGLTIDAHVYLSPGSRRTNHYANTYNYTALLAAELSDYEAGMFTELGGLNAVSTVRGIQYAAAHPTDYTVYSINKNNIGQIDSLQLSTNTKNNMKKDVMSGALVITPNKPITNGEFSGIVYASLGPTILRFAIGEQSQSNGGFTHDKFVRETPTFAKFETSIDPIITFKHLEKLTDSKPSNCSISQQDEAAIMQLTGYTQAVGTPCLKIRQLAMAGTAVHEASAGPAWNYYLHLKNIIISESGNANLGTISFKNIDYDPLTGAFKLPGTYYNSTIFSSSPIDFYIYPDSLNPHAFAVYGDFKAKFDSKVYCPDLKGQCPLAQEIEYPVSFPQQETTYTRKLNTVMQQKFKAGSIFIYQMHFGGNHSAYSTQELLAELNTAGGISKYGAPYYDPASDNSNAQIYQKLESGYEIRADKLNEKYTSLGIQKGSEMMSNEEFNEGFYDAFLENGFIGFVINVGVGALAGAIVEIALNPNGPLVKKLGKVFVAKLGAKIGLRILPGLNIVLIGASSILITKQVAPLAAKCGSAPTSGDATPAYYCGKTAGTAFLLGVGAIPGIGISAGVSKYYISRAVRAETQALAMAGKMRIVELSNPKESAFAQYGNALGKLSAEDRTYALANVAEMVDGDRVLFAKNINNILNEAKSLPNISGFKTVAGKPVAKFRYGWKYKYKEYKNSNGDLQPGFEPDYYSKPNEFSLPYLKSQGIIPNDRNTFYKINELSQIKDIIINKNLDAGYSPFDLVKSPGVGEIVFVEKLDGTILMSPRLNGIGSKFILPHPYLSGGEDVLSAGVLHLNPTNPNEFYVFGASGHFMPIINSQTFQRVIDAIKLAGYSAKYIPFNP